MDSKSDKNSTMRGLNGALRVTFIFVALLVSLIGIATVLDIMPQEQFWTYAKYILSVGAIIALASVCLAFVSRARL